MNSLRSPSSTPWVSAGDFVNEKGVLIGNDGHNDGKVYVLKTTTQYFGENKDDIYGNGGTRDENNREYGGHFTKEGVREVEAGPVAKPGDKNVSVTLLFPNHTCHSHPSGGNTGGFLQFPSKTDLDNTRETTSYVFGRGNNTTYIFNSSGVLATIPTSRFVDFKRPKK